jgi:hypothetical protein
MKENIGLYLLILSTGVLLSIIGCKDIDIQSTWRNQDIIIDGSDTEWKDLLMYHNKSKIAFASCNDDKNLYLIMVIGDREEQRQIMRSGLTVYLDGTGGSDESFGVHFPLGMKGGPQPMSDERTDKQHQMKDFSRNSQKEMSFDFKGTEMEIIGPGDNETTRMSIAGGKGIQISMERSQDKLIYELKIALTRTVDEPYGVNAIAGSTIGIGFVVNETENNKGDRPGGDMGGGPPGGGMGGGPPGGGMGGGPPSGGMGGGPSEGGAGREKTQDALDIWANLRLATPKVIIE